ncbi:hypothetical protein FOQG_01281 [Fusarium oxysporum f. sp. raphani 54005]|uniref:Uncharacterized protein n=1 Tax=Fusarium oxysporum f. sp. raphani 54005 TaxID=1089458 RepID=X0CV53_FUSOX|nr:hypothetical protein FOQG_01281 [Fusarium oxysporum f. sp. raphani 54005]
MVRAIKIMPSAGRRMPGNKSREIYPSPLQNYFQTAHSAFVTTSREFVTVLESSSASFPPSSSSFSSTSPVHSSRNNKHTQEQTKPYHFQISLLDRVFCFYPTLLLHILHLLTFNMVRTLYMSHRHPLTVEMFETNDYLRFDLEHPQQAVIVPTKYNSRIRMERDVEEIVAKMKESRERFGVMGRDRILNHGQVRSTIATATYIVESMNVIVKRYYFDREEGLRVKKQREYAAIQDAGISKPFKHAAIALRYNMDLREKWFAFKVAQRGRQMEDGLEKLKRYSAEALFVSNGNEPHWGPTLA